MKERDGIILSDKAVWEMSFGYHFIILLKRMIALPSKMLGFKPFCLYLATWLLVNKHIGQWVWLAVLMMVLFGIVGLKVAGSILTRRSSG
ncbi:hypothetical protein EXM22_01860 [Oceanispirochaeta crateris]|uniref:Uncharacterized protein n=1 Tax=Oceanispirochaeta crateris TaxID=2518645 RepID=A0A5C1QFI1_9SPIO|nr:hypothetical protein [Oceanispirochaeta crateris]QEN06795.1 hypothetical protein EXM22_01860 [Oceanispirochaeta crateris]